MRAAVLGRPVAHSLSPALHEAAYAALGLDWTYTTIECGEADLLGLLQSHAEWAGFSCTMPLKRAAFEATVERSPTATAVGAANTLLPDGRGWWRSDNTDVDGVRGALAGASVAGSTVTVLGAGGTAQAVLAAVTSARAVTVLVRDLTRTEAVTATASRLGMPLAVAPLTPDAPELAADVVVSTLPAGAADPLVGYAWRPGQTLLDVIYAPWPTELATAATAAGATVIGGAEMLLHQAARQVELMTGHDAPVEAMRAALPAPRA